MLRCRKQLQATPVLVPHGKHGPRAFAPTGVDDCWANLVKSSVISRGCIGLHWRDIADLSRVASVEDTSICSWSLGVTFRAVRDHLQKRGLSGVVT